MKSLLFCLFFLLIFFHPIHSYAAGVKTFHRLQISQKELSAHAKSLQQTTSNYFQDDLLDMDDDDESNDPDDENGNFALTNSESFYSIFHDAYNSGLKTVRSTGYFFPSTPPVFILFSVFRL